MGLEAIIVEILETTAVETLDQLTNLVAAHHAYTGKSKGRALENRIKRILQNERFRQEIEESNVSEDNISLGFKIGRLEIKGKYDLS